MQGWTEKDTRAVIARVLLAALAGGLTMRAFVSNLEPFLLYAAGVGGGIMASYVMSQIRGSALRGWIEAHQSSDNAVLRWLAGGLGWLFFSPATAAMTVVGLTSLITGGATVALAYAAGTPTDQLWPVLVAFISSQITYWARHDNPEPQVSYLKAEPYGHGNGAHFYPANPNARPVEAPPYEYLGGGGDADDQR